MTKVTRELAVELLAGAALGPWDYDTTALVGANGRVVADIIDCESDSDATLIAAAPDLAATVVALSDELRDLTDAVVSASRGVDPDVSLAARIGHDALDAIAELRARDAELMAALAAARRAASLAEAERDVLRDLTDGMRVDNVRLRAERCDLRDERDGLMAAVERITSERDGLRAIVAGRATAPTDAEIAAHTRAGGVWLVTWEIAGAGLLDGPAAVRAADSARGGGYAVPITRWVAVLDGRPCAWPTTGDAAGEAGRAKGERR